MSNASSLLSARPELADRLAEITPLTLARDRVLPVAEHLHPLVRGPGLQRGISLSVQGSSGALSLSFSLLAEATRQGAWVAVVGGSWLGLGAIVELGIPIERLVLIEEVAPSLWSSVVAALLDGFDIVVSAHPGRVGARDSRQLVARTRERSAVLVRVGGPSWADAADLRFDVAPADWGGIGAGHGHVQSRLVSVASTGRRGATRPRRHLLWLPDSTGDCRLAERSEWSVPVPSSQPTPQPVPPRPSPVVAASAPVAYAGSDIDRLLDVDPNGEAAEGVAEEDRVAPRAG